MVSPIRALAVTLGLAVVGACVGALCSVTTLTIYALATGLLRDLLGAPFGFVAIYGAILGALIGPAFAWLLLRHVPLGRAVLQSAIGTLVGALVAFALPEIPLFTELAIPTLLYAPVAGFLLAAVRLRRRTPHPALGVPPGSDDTSGLTPLSHAQATDDATGAG